VSGLRGLFCHGGHESISPFERWLGGAGSPEPPSETIAVGAPADANDQFLALARDPETSLRSLYYYSPGRAPLWNHVAFGTYSIRLVAGATLDTRKVLLMK